MESPVITFPPQMRDGSPDAMVYRHIASQQSKILRDQLALGKLNMGTRRVTLNNGVEITCTYCYGKEDIFVKIPPVVVGTVEVEQEEFVHGFALHPRTSTYPNGANFNKELSDEVYEQLQTTAMFPLYDNDHGTLKMSLVGDEWVAEIADPDNYGIHAWTSEGMVITWRGWPCRTVGCGRETSIEGVTQLDVQTAYNTYYTPLFAYLYVDGEAVPVPGKVRGAGYSSAGAVFISTVNYTQYDFVGMGSNEVNPDGLDWLYDNPGSVIDDSNKAGKVGNYYDELYVQAKVGVPYTVNGRVRYATSGATNQEGQSVDGWLRIGHRISPITNLSVWFSADGKSAVEDGGTWSWSANGATFTSSFAARTDSVKHEYTVYGTPNPWKVLGNTTWHSMYMLTKYGTVVFSRDDKTVSTGKSHEDYDRYSVVPVYHQSRPDPTNPYLSWDWTYTNNVYTVSFYNNKSGPITWDSGAPIIEEGDGYIKVDVSTVCGTFGITATDNCGITASMTRRGALGRWASVQYAKYTLLCYPYVPVDSCNGSNLFAYYEESYAEKLAEAAESGAGSFTVRRIATRAEGADACGQAVAVGDALCWWVYTWTCT